jgi:hypothetical protein
MASSKPHAQTAIRKRRSRRRRLGVIAAVAAVAAIVVGVLVGRALTDDRPTPSVAAAGHGGELPPGYRLTGEMSPMGGPVIETPGTRSGEASAGGVVVTDGSDIAMGHVPLAYAVNPTWHLRNAGDQPVTLGTPKVTVVKGCCPAEPILGATALAPGEETTLEFPTQMHPGMDGDHLFRLAIPVSGAAEPLVVSVAGDFS